MKHFVRWLPVLLLPLSALLHAHHGPTQPEDPSGAGWPLDSFALVDHRGAPFDEARLKGRWTFVMFGDTRCESPCTGTLTAVVGLFRRIAGTEAVKTTQLAFVTLDPARDSPAAVARYLQPFESGVAPPAPAPAGAAPSPRVASPLRFVGVTGDVAGVRRLADELKALDDAATVGASPKYRGSLVLIGPDGVVRTEFLPPFDVERLTAAFLLTRARR